MRGGAEKYHFFSFSFSKYCKAEVGERRSRRAYEDLVAMLVTVLRIKVS